MFASVTFASGGLRPVHFMPFLVKSNFSKVVKK